MAQLNTSKESFLIFSVEELIYLNWFVAHDCLKIYCVRSFPKL